MSPQDAFGRETQDDRPRARRGPPRWVLYMVAFDVLIVVVVLAVVLA